MYPFKVFFFLGTKNYSEMINVLRNGLYLYNIAVFIYQL